MPVFLAWILGPIGRWVVVGIVALLSIGGIYEKGRFDQRAYDKTKLEKQINDAIAKGDKGRADALRSLDSSGVPNGWYRD